MFDGNAESLITSSLLYMAPYVQVKEKRGETQDQQTNVFRNSTDCTASIDTVGGMSVSLI